MATGCIDKDMGLKSILEQMNMLGDKRVKAGLPKGSGTQDGVDIAQYAAWDEYGVRGKKTLWATPPRPFIRGWLAAKAGNIKTTFEKLGKMVTEGKLKADDAVKRLGQFSQDGIKTYIQNGIFVPNADATVKRKKSSKPLIDSRTMLRAVRYEVIGKNDPVEGPVEG